MKRLLHIKLLALSIALSLLFSCSGKKSISDNPVHLFSALGDAALSQHFSVKVNGQEAPVECIKNFDIPIHYVHMTYDEKQKVTITIEADESIKSYAISPLRLNIKGWIQNNKLTFTISDASYLIVKINNMDDIFFLIDKPINYYKIAETKGKVVNIDKYNVDATGHILETKKIQQAIDEVSAKHGVLYFPKGYYKTGQLNMRSNMTILLDEGTLIQGSIDSTDYSDKTLIRIDHISNFNLLGYGTIDGAGWSGLRKSGVRDFHLVYASECKNVYIDGLILRDPTFWNTRIYRSKNVQMRNIKILNNRPKENWTNTDGVDFDSSVDCSLIRAIIHAGDDNVVVKGLDDKRKYSTENIRFENILTKSNSAACKIGTETCVKDIKNIVFKDIDIVSCKRAMVIDAFDSAQIKNVKFENIFIEKFDSSGSENSYFIDFKVTNSAWRKSKGDCSIKNILIKNINTKYNIRHVRSQIIGRNKVFNIENIKFENIKTENEPINSIKDLGLKTNKYVKNIIIK